jgi:hypothetical protein
VYIRPPPPSASGSDSTPTHDRTSIPAYQDSPFSSQDGAVAVSSSLYDFADVEPHGILTPGFFSSSEDGVDLPAFLDPGIGPAALELLHTTSNPGPPPPSPEGLDEWMLQPVPKAPGEARDAVLKHSSK